MFWRMSVIMNFLRWQNFFADVWCFVAGNWKRIINVVIVIIYFIFFLNMYYIQIQIISIRNCISFGVACFVFFKEFYWFLCCLCIEWCFHNFMGNDGLFEFGYYLFYSIVYILLYKIFLQNVFSILLFFIVFYLGSSNNL